MSGASPLTGGDPSVAGPLGAPAAEALLRRGEALAASGDYADSAAAFARLVGHADPAIHVAALLGVAEARYRLDDEPAALQAWIVATQAPETEHTWRAWKQLAAARVRERDLAGAARAYREAERRAPPDERPEIASRLGWLNKEMGQDRAASRYFGRARTSYAPAPVVTYAILAVTIAIGVASFLPTGGGALWYDLLQLDKQAVATGEWYRLLTVALVHAPLIVMPFHLLFNMYALYVAGPIVESLYGPLAMLGIYLLCAAAGSIASFIATPTTGVGASGAIFGLFGLLLVANRVYRPALGRQARALTSQVGMLIAINLVFGFVIPGIDNAAHIGGLVAGSWLGLILVPRTATLASFWRHPTGRGPQGAAAAPDGSRGRRAATEVVLRLLGIVALVAVLVVLFAVGAGRYR